MESVQPWKCVASSWGPRSPIFCLLNIACILLSRTCPCWSCTYAFWVFLFFIHSCSYMTFFLIFLTSCANVLLSWTFVYSSFFFVAVVMSLAEASILALAAFAMLLVDCFNWFNKAFYCYVNSNIIYLFNSPTLSSCLNCSFLNKRSDCFCFCPYNLKVILHSLCIMTYLFQSLLL